MDFDRRNEICLFFKLFFLDIFIKIVFVFLYRFCEVSYLGDFGIVLIINIFKIDGRVEVIVRYR